MSNPYEDDFTVQEDEYGKKELVYTGPKPVDDTEGALISIAKWETMERLFDDGQDVNQNGSDTCGFCMLYFHHFCEGCPVMRYSGYSMCVGTPFIDFIAASQAFNFITASRAYGPKHLVDLAQREVIFLKAVKREIVDKEAQGDS